MTASQAIRPAEGLFAPPRRIDALADLLANVWQFGYVTTDLDRAVEFMSERFGLEHCLKLPAGGATFLVGDEPAEWDAKFAMGARGGKIIELIEPVAGHIDFYTVPIPNRVRAGYVDTTAELGHWLEICQLQREDIEFFSGLVSDSA
jgi:hypothetical protein